MQQFTELLKKYKLAAAIGALLVVGLIVYGVMSWHNGISNVGREKQRDIVTMQRGIETALSTCLDSGNVAAKVVMQANATLKDQLVSVAAARYTDDGDPTRAQATGGSLISMIQEQYPLIDQAGWNNLQTLVVACRKDVKDAQDLVQFHAGEFDKWRTTGGVIERTVRNNFPNDELTVTTIKGETLTGLTALKYLTKVISVADAKTAMDTGVTPEQDLFGKPTPAPVPSATSTR